MWCYAITASFKISQVKKMKRRWHESSSKSTTNRYVCRPAELPYYLTRSDSLFCIKVCNHSRTKEAEIIQGLVRSALQSSWHINLFVFQCWKPDAMEDYYFYRAKVLPGKPLSTSIVSAWWNGRIHFVFFCIAVKTTLKLKEHCCGSWTGREQSRNLEKIKGGSPLWNPT